MAAKTAAARELWEETGLDVRNQLERLKEAPLKQTTQDQHELTCELDRRLYFYLGLKRDDFKYMVWTLILLIIPIFWGNK